jgi:tetratricopeptide (TPR) repeat protein
MTGPAIILAAQAQFPGSHDPRLSLSLERDCLVRVGAQDGFGGESPMGRMTGRDPNRLTLSLVGNFRLCDPDGRDIRVTEKKARVLLAMLATARDQRRSREWLKSRLWERSFDEQASNSLRQCLHVLRKALHPHSDAVQADYEHVWLAAVDVRIDPGGDPRAEFFEDAPRLGEAGEDWLRDERQAFAARQEDPPRAMVDLGETAAVAPVVFPSAPVVIIGTPIVVADDMRAAAVAERITSMMQETFRANGFVETYDLRDVETNQLEGRSVDAVAHPPVLVEVRVSVLGQELQATLVARVPATGRVIWTSSIASDRDGAFSISSETMLEFVMGAVDSIEGLILRQPGLGARPTLYTAVHQLFGLSPEGIEDACAILRQFLDGKAYSANAEAWLAFTCGVTVGEGHNVHPDLLDAASAHFEHALDMEPSNALVLALAGHFEGFVRRDFALGRSHLAESRRILPNLAIAWDSTAMNLIYTDELDSGAEAAEIARRLGRYSPYRFWYDASAAIAASLQGRHQDAVRIGTRVLAKRPFMPVMRHLFASHAEVGNMPEALALYQEIRRHDPAFGTEAMAAPNYAMPSPRSLSLIEGGLRRVGLIEAPLGRAG